MPTVMTFGDSNTYGTRPMIARDSTARFAKSYRWTRVFDDDNEENRTGILSQKPGKDEWEVIVEGLPGRTTCFSEAETGVVMRGTLGLQIALRSHGPIDYLTIMLGTNDCKAEMQASPEQIADGMAQLLDIAKSDDLQARHDGFKILLICPPPLQEVGFLAEDFRGGREKSLALAPLAQEVAKSRNVGFLDLGTITALSEHDGIHFNARDLDTVGAAVLTAIRKL